MAVKYWKRLHLPPVGVTILLAGALVRLMAMLLAWPIVLVIASQVLLFMAAVWVVIFDILPLLLPIFVVIKNDYSRKNTFFATLVILFVAFQLITRWLPSGAIKDTTTSLAFFSFIASMVWLISVWLLTTFTPFIATMRRQTRVDDKITFGDVVSSMAVILLPQVALTFFFLPPGLVGQPVTPTQVFLTSLLTDFFILAYIYLFVIRPKVFTWRQLGLKKVDRQGMGRAFVLFIAVIVVIGILQALLQRLGLPLQRFTFSTDQGAILALVVTVFVTPLVEELYFRGFLFKGLLMHNRPWVAFVVSAGLFALLHPPILAMVDVFVVGLLLAYLVKQTKSIWPSVLVHALNNAVVFGYLLFGFK